MKDLTLAIANRYDNVDVRDLPKGYAHIEGKSGIGSEVVTPGRER
jgi:hypothetical protein